MIFGNSFDQSIIIPISVKSLTFGRRFSQDIIIPNSVETLTFADYYNQLIDLPDSLINLTIGKNFNRHVNIPNSVISLNISDFIHIPLSVTNLTLMKFPRNIILHKNIKNLNINFRCKTVINKSRRYICKLYDNYEINLNEIIVIPDTVESFEIQS